MNFDQLDPRSMLLTKTNDSYQCQAPYGCINCELITKEILMLVLSIKQSFSSEYISPTVKRSTASNVSESKGDLDLVKRGNCYQQDGYFIFILKHHSFGVSILPHSAPEGHSGYII